MYSILEDHWPLQGLLLALLGTSLQGSAQSQDMFFNFFTLNSYKTKLIFFFVYVDFRLHSFEYQC